MNEWTDERLIEAARKGNHEAFIRFGRYKRRVISLATRFTIIRDEVEDICQDVFLKVFRRLGSFNITLCSNIGSRASP